MGVLEDQLEQLELPQTLRERVQVTQDAPQSTGSFVLYLPTVVLRSHHNPALAVAARLANHHQVPLVILAVVLDDSLHPVAYPQPLAATSRRLCFVLQALQKAVLEWDALGASVWIRVLGEKARTPHHLTLAGRAIATVTDEPFVEPYRSFVRSVENVAHTCVRVDGSTTVPPLVKLKRRLNEAGDAVFDGVPNKAWLWQKATDAKRKPHVYGAAKYGEMDAPQLQNRDGGLQDILPVTWFDEAVSAPNSRPWTAAELVAVDAVTFSQQYPGWDTSVPPCRQTHGAHGWDRWQSFRNGPLQDYARRRNDILQPHAVSRLSCYLNYGTISIFRIVYELWQLTIDTTKFEDEIVKWREISYAHAFSTPHYFSPSALPNWSRRWLETQQHSANASIPLEVLAQAKSGDKTWDAMQAYLVRTGELHNNARMTWGKTVVHWHKSEEVSELLKSLSFLNDRFALDGLSPPSYAGLLWCLGWCDKPAPNGGGISEKPAARYRRSPDDFDRAEQLLLTPSTSTRTFFPQSSAKKARVDVSEGVEAKGTTTSPAAPMKTILDYFATKGTGPKHVCG